MGSEMCIRDRFVADKEIVTLLLDLKQSEGRKDTHTSCLQELVETLTEPQGLPSVVDSLEVTM